MRNITLKKFIKHKEAHFYDAILRHIKPKNSFAGQQMNVNKMPYINVKYCIRFTSQIDTWDHVQQLFELCYFNDLQKRIDDEYNASRKKERDVRKKHKSEADLKQKFWNASVLEFYEARKYLTEALNKVVENEVKLLYSNSINDDLWKIAGSDKLKPYNDTLPLVQLGKMYGMYPYDLGKMPYGEVLSILSQNKVQNEVEQEYQRLKLNNK